MTRLSKHNTRAIVATTLLLGPTAGVHAADIVISAGAGFNDNTPAAPVGGNGGTTVGEQRLIAFEFAASLWSAILESDEQIIVAAQFAPQSCDADGGVLGGASPVSIEADFANAPIPDTWYFSALANALAGTDLNPGAADINATFNSSIDNNNNCLANSNWYYGLDNAPTAGDIDFLNVVMHEIGHGLGSASVLSVSNGSLPLGRADIYSRLAFDTSLMLHFDEMTNNQRAAAVTNTGNVAWDGPAVNGAAPAILGGALQGEITNPPLGQVLLQTASFGPPVPNSGLSGTLVLANDGVGAGNDACEALTPASAAQVAGNIALIDRGSCNFTVKTVNAEAAGAVAVVIVNNVASGLPPLGGNDSSIGIPTVGVTQATGDDIKAQLPGVQINFSFDTSQLAGANAAGQVLLFAPSPVQPGSSFSHWDTTARPNLLMEPSITGTLEARVNVDLTPALYADIGWGIVDEDGDQIPDINDNCTLVANTDQRDSNQDGFGNICDADINNDGIVNALDLGLLRVAFFSAGPDADFDGDGVVNVVDLGILRQLFFSAPGPSGVAL